MTIKDALNFGYKKIRQVSDSPLLDLEVILSYVIQNSREYLATHPERILLPAEEKVFRKMVEKRKEGWPVAYLVKKKEFFGLDFYVDKHVLIPRPETEILVEQTMEEVRKIKAKTIVDVGTGSGIIAIVLANKFKDQTFYASDISKKTLDVAKLNTKHYNLKNIKFIRGDLLKPFKNTRVDIICANLPYGNESWVKSNLLKHEPKKAIVSGNGGFEHLIALIKQANKYFKAKPILLLEIDPRQVKKLVHITRQINKHAQVKIIKDLAGLDRVIRIKLQ